MAAIGRALMLRPKLLMLDEPSLGLAPVLVANIYKTIGELGRQGQTILLVEQNVGECLDVSDRAYVLQTGRIVRSGPSEELRASEDVREAFLGI
jgi:branched-chain amino acid transport system ATP-binding protein